MLSADLKYGCSNLRTFALGKILCLCFGGGVQPTDLETAEDDFEKILEKIEDLIKIFNCSKVCICKKRNGKMGIK